MKSLGYIFIALFFITASLSGQTQYTSVPRTGDGRFNRSDNTVFWANPIFFKPAVFFSSSEMNVRANRKWWQDDEPLLPKPYVIDGYLPEDSILTRRLLAGQMSTPPKYLLDISGQSLLELRNPFFPTGPGADLRSFRIKEP